MHTVSISSASRSPVPPHPGAGPRRWRVRGWGRALLNATALGAAMLGATVLGSGAFSGCAKSSDLERLDETNRVQEQRLRALENDLGGVLREQREVLEQLRNDMRAVRGQMQIVNETATRLTNEQTAITEGLERTLAEQRRVGRKVDEDLAQLAKFKTESQSEQDKLRIQAAELEKLLRSPIARLPAKTAADTEFRQAFFHLLNGELDLAADRFEQFRKAHPTDERGPEALFRRGQAFFLMRRYDHSLVAFFELVDKAPQHALATPGRWMLARALEETGDLKLAREFYAQLINDKTAYAADATRRVAFINRLFPRSEPPAGGSRAN